MPESDSDKTQNMINHESIKTNVKVGIGVEILAQVPRLMAQKPQKLSLVASQISKIVDYIYFSLYGVLAARLLVVFLAENSINGLVRVIKNIADPFYSPFKGIFPSLTAEFGVTLAIPIIIAIFFYMFLYLIINGLLTLLGNRKSPY